MRVKVEFMMNYLEKGYGIQAMDGKLGTLEALQKESKELEAQLEARKKHKSKSTKKAAYSDDDTDSDQESDYHKEEPEKVERVRRKSVSAEAFGSWNQRKIFIPKVFQKSSESLMSLREQLDKSFMFSSLEEHEKLIVMNAMEEVITDTKEEVIRQGDEGDCLYVIGSGTL